MLRWIFKKTFSPFEALFIGVATFCTPNTFGGLLGGLLIILIGVIIQVEFKDRLNLK